MPGGGFEMDKPLTKQEAAKFFQVSERTLDRWRAEGFIKCFKHGNTVRFDPQHLAAVIDKKTRAKGG